jgi:hypothetical protein
LTGIAPPYWLLCRFDWMVPTAKLFRRGDRPKFRRLRAITLGLRLSDGNSGGSREYRPVASIASPNPCPGWAVAGKLLRRQRKKFRGQYGHVVARYPNHDQRAFRRSVFLFQLARDEVLADFPVFHDHEEIPAMIKRMALHQVLDTYNRGEARCENSASDLF